MRYCIAILLVVMAVPPARADCGGADDFGNSAGVATSVSPGTNAHSGLIEWDADSDWFDFRAQPSTTYAISISTTTVWDATVTLRAPDGSTILTVTNTARGGSPAQATFTNGGTVASFYLEVHGFLDFTTGAYAFVVNPLNFVDSDTDGLSDAWETSNFGTLTNGAAGDNDGDGLSNLDEFYLGSSPGLATSGLFMQDIDRAGTNVTVTWQSGLYGTYRVLACSNLLGAQVWAALGTNVNLDGSAIESFSQHGQTNASVNYRVEFIY